MENIRTTLIQADLAWEAPQVNRERFQKMIFSLAGQSDLIILPEMFTTGFSMQAEALAEPMEGPSMNWMHQMAEETAAVISGSLIIAAEGGFCNRLIWMQPDGSYQYYDKKHLFTLAGEGQFKAGKNRIIIDYKGWRILPLICYDLRFPVWSRNTDLYDLLIYIASWPSTRIQAWQTLLQARAIENQVYTIGVNRIGEDGSGYKYSGYSSVVSYDGTLLYHNKDQEAVFTASLNRESLYQYRATLPFLEDMDSFSMKGL